MNNKIEIFKNEDLGSVRFISIDDKEYAVGIDVAKALGYQNPSNAIMKHCKHSIKKTLEADTQKGDVVKTETTLINEGDIYRLIIIASNQSKNLEIKKKAEKFETWVMDEVLPSIRKHGLYIKDELLQDNDRLQNAITELQIENKLKESKINELEELRKEYMTQRDKIFKIQIKSRNDNGSFIPYCILQLVKEFIKEPDNIEYKDNDIIKVNSKKLIKFTKRLFPKNHDAQYYLSTCLDIKTWDKCSIISTKILKEDYEPIQDILF